MPMAVKGKYEASLNCLDNYLKTTNLCFERNHFVNRRFQRNNIDDSSGYLKFWESYYSNGYYDFQLKDGGLLYYGDFQDNPCSFTYLGRPRKYVSYEDFLYIFDIVEANDYDLSGDYYNYLTEQEVELYPSYVRYDYDEDSYNSGLHPCGHIHIGYMQSNRIGLRHKMTIFSFASFILRQFYSKSWAQVLENPKKYPQLFKFKDALSKISDKFYLDLDSKQDMYLF